MPPSRYRLLGLAGLLVAAAATAHTPSPGETGASVPRVQPVRAIAADPASDVIEAGWGVPDVPHDEMSPAERERIQSEIASNRARLVALGLLPRSGEKALTTFGWPLRLAAGRTDFNYHAISAFVDENAAFPNQLLDYACGARTYDTASGYNHQGTDIYLTPFAWRKMGDSDVVIVAGAPGTIVNKADGNFDMSCAMNGNPWNAVYVQHADGSVAWYGHMKSGSTTVKGVGEKVIAGEYLGAVGSSGSSTGPHLHIELYDAGNNLVDPWLGACNAKSKQVTFAQQRPYRDTGVNLLTVGTSPALFPTCPSTETSYATDWPPANTKLYFTVFLRDQTVSTPLAIRVLRPDGSVFMAPAASGAADYNSAYYYWSANSLPALAGNWTFEATIAGRTYTKTFQVGGSAPFGAPVAIAQVAGSGQSTAPDAVFAAPLQVRVTDNGGNPVKGARVDFTVPASTGPTAVLESKTAVTDAQGTASVAALANAKAGAYNVTATLAGTAASTSFSLLNAPPPPAATRLANISTRMQVLTGSDVLIGGFVIGGGAPKTVVVRARGPSLAGFGIANFLANPVLQLFSGPTQIAANDDWRATPNAVLLELSGFAPPNPFEAALYTTLSPGPYTAIVTGAGGQTGVGIIEVFEVDRPEFPLVNISTRGQVLTANDVMIGGFIIQGDQPQTVVVRARGPSLAGFGIANFLANPKLDLYSGQALIASNDDWGSAANAPAIQSSGFAPASAAESALLVTLNPGAYTAIVSGVGGTTGVGIVEVFAQ